MTLDEALSQSHPTDRGVRSAEAETSRGVYIADQRGTSTIFSLDDGACLMRVDPNWLPANLSWKPMRPTRDEQSREGKHTDADDHE